MLGIRGGMMGKAKIKSASWRTKIKMIEDQDERKFVSRLRRMVGQTQSLERILAEDDRVKFIGQLEAVIAASRAILSQYAQTRLINSDNPEDRKLLKRIIRKG